jgi:osmotically-inducible protein OsmY
MVRLALLVACVLTVGACAALEPGRSMGRQLDDVNASLAVKSAMLRSEGYGLDRVDVEITEGVMLLTGAAPRAVDSVYAECLAWSAPGVRSVVNEIEVGEWRDARALARDQMITSRVRARLVQDREIRSVNINIEVRQAVVYLLGYARSRAEADLASGQAARVGGVERVVDLIRVTGETPDLPARGALRAQACDAAAGPALPVAAPAAEAGAAGAEPVIAPAPGPSAAPATPAPAPAPDSPEAPPF